jgi:hypothetical protein
MARPLFVNSGFVRLSQVSDECVEPVLKPAIESAPKRSPPWMHGAAAPLAPAAITVLAQQAVVAKTAEAARRREAMSLETVVSPSSSAGVAGLVSGPSAADRWTTGLPSRPPSATRRSAFRVDDAGKPSSFVQNKRWA